MPRVHVWLSGDVLARLDGFLDGRPRSRWVAGVVVRALDEAGAGVEPVLPSRALVEREAESRAALEDLGGSRDER